MKIKHFLTKDISFMPSERKKATALVLRLLKKGWQFQEGEIDAAGQVVGDKSVDGTSEEVQLYFCF